MSLRRRRRDHRGQALVEFALTLPIFVLLIFGLIDVGRFVFSNSALSQAAREGARVGAVQAFWMGSTDPSCNQPGGPVCPADVAALRANVLAATNGMMSGVGTVVDADLYTSCDATTPPSGSWTTKTCTSRNAGQYMSVRVVMRFQPITPIIGQLIPGVTLAGSATMVIN
jgi:Flp pilus assembly protein TadG